MVLYGIAALAIPSIMPYTIGVMHPGANLRLIALADEAEQVGKGKSSSVSDDEVQPLLGKWKAMNDVRVVLVGTGAALGAIAAIAM